MESLLIAIATMGGLGLLFAAFLAIADKKLRVEEDPRIAQVNDALPGANCGACGKAGCYDFATQVVAGEADHTGCPVGGQDTADEVAEILGLEKGETVKLLPRVLCNGGNIEAARKLVSYHGPQSCSAMHLISGGDKLCFYGCLGGGDCVKACPFDAMVMTDNGLPEVMEDICTGCGICAKACPRDIIEIHPSNHDVFVFCKNQDDPKTSKDVCSVACIGCGICARKSEGGVEMHGNLAVVNHEKLDPTLIPFDKCKTHAIYPLSGLPEKEEVTEEKAKA